MKFSVAPGLLCTLALASCAPEVIDLVTYGRDAGAAAPLDASSPGTLDSDGDLNQGPADAGFDAGGTSAVTDARVREDAHMSGTRGGCRGPDDCGSNQTCDFVGCGPDKMGTCVPLTSSCSGAGEEVCGCDGLKYFNDCLRRRHGVAKDESCSELRSCDRGAACPAGPTGKTYCSHLVSRAQCSRPNQATRACYVMPERCQFADLFGGDLFSSCDAVMSGAAATGFELCYSPCEAIKMQMPFAPTRLERCAVPTVGGMGGGGGPGFPGTFPP